MSPPLPNDAISAERLAELLAGQAAAIERRNRRAAPPITRILPQSFPLSLGGVECLVGELTLSDVAAIQAWLTARTPDPLLALGSAATDEPPADRRRRLIEAWHAARDWPIRFGSSAARSYLTSPEGMGLILSLVLARYDRRNLDQVVTIAGAMNLAEWSALYRAAYATEPWQALLAELDPDSQDDSPSRLMDWIEAFDELAKTYGWTPEQVGKLTLSQWRAIRGGSDAFAYKLPLKPGETPAEALARERRIFSPHSRLTD